MKPNQQIEEANNVACFDGSIKQVESRKEYLSGLTNPNPGLWIGRDSLGHGRLSRFSIKTFFLTSLLFIIYLPHLFFGKNRASYALLILEYCEWCVLLKSLKEHDIQKVYFFCSFELDGNFISLLLMEEGISFIRIPSSNPLSYFYEDVVTDKFALTAPFHSEELKLLGNWKYNELVNLPCFNYKQLLKLREIEPNPARSDRTRTLAVMTRGIWRRIERGDSANDRGEYRSELELLDHLREYIQLNPEIEVTILMHPCEKVDDALFERAKDYYRETLKKKDLIFPARNKNSLECFYDSNVAISTNSSTNIERLFLGLKTLYFPAYLDFEIFTKTRLANISCKTKEQLFSDLDWSFNSSNQEFFTKKEIEDYFEFGLANDR
ncbi:hypothetical protein [Halocola ammonii]